MKLRYVLLLITVIAIAASTGWLFDFKGSEPPQQTLQTPDNIDYYLKTVDYRAFGDDGKLQYQLITPYLEHFIREDSSHLQRPDLDYYADSEQWKVTSRSGILLHGDETFTLKEQVNVHRVVGEKPFLLESETVILRSREDQMEVPTAMTLLHGGLTLHAASAMLDMKQKQHHFTRVKATYDDKKDTAG